jgi:TatD DNase family protein
MSPHSSGHHGLPDRPDPLPIDVVDNHVHLDITREGDAPFDVAEAVAWARSVGVTRMVQVGCDLEGIAFTVDAIDRFPELVGGIALHPNEVPRLAAAGRLEEAYAQVERHAAHERVRAIGETGLDYFRTGPEGIPVQQDGFRWHIDLAKRLGKALQIHDRDAHDDVLRILDEEGAPERTVLHCFSGDLTMALRCVERGYYLSFAGTVTFKNARGLRDALAATPLDHLLVETDAPYLAPSPHRGATNASYLVPVTLRAMAGVLNVDVPSLCRAVSENSERVYGSWRPAGTAGAAEAASGPGRTA